MSNSMSSNIIEEVGTEVAQFMGYNNLKPEQEQIINGILSKYDVMEFYQLDLAIPFVTLAFSN